MQSSVEDLLAQLAASASSERAKGDLFERLVCRWLTILELVTRIITASVRTVEIVDTLPHLVLNEHRATVVK